jgi:hypothetical protein
MLDIFLKNASQTWSITYLLVVVWPWGLSRKQWSRLIEYLKFYYGINKIITPQHKNSIYHYQCLINQYLLYWPSYRVLRWEYYTAWLCKIVHLQRRPRRQPSRYLNKKCVNILESRLMSKLGCCRAKFFPSFVADGCAYHMFICHKSLVHLPSTSYIKIP